MSLLFADIFEAIRYLRLCKGTTEKNIFDYVKERTGGCLTPAQILKTFRALQKLVDEGVLVKNGKRYTFPTKPKIPEDDDDGDEDEEKDCEEEPEEEEEEDDDSGDDDDDEEEDEDEEDEDEEEDKCNECPSSGDDDDEDDDDDDDEEEEDDDEEDDDAEACDKIELPEQPEEEPRPNPAVKSEDNVVKAISTNQNSMLVDKNNRAKQATEKKDANGSGCTNPNPNSKQVNKKLGVTQKGTNNDSAKTGYSKNESVKTGIVKHEAGKHSISKYDESAVNKAENRKTECKKTGTKKHEKKRSKVKTNSEPKSANDNKEKAVTTTISEKEKVKKRSPSKIRDHQTDPCQKGRSRKSRTKNPSHRSGESSMKKLKAAVYSMSLDHPLEFGSFSNTSQVCPESMETNLLLENDVEDNRMDYDLYRHRSPAGPPPPNTPGVHLNRKESCCSNNMDKFTPNEEIKLQSPYEEDNQYSLSKSLDSKHSVISIREDESNRFAKDCGNKLRDKLKRDLSIDGDHLGLGPFGDKSLCSVCKKKRIS